jgi:hypothetical protein
MRLVSQGLQIVSIEMYQPVSFRTTQYTWRRYLTYVATKGYLITY